MKANELRIGNLIGIVPESEYDNVIAKDGLVPCEVGWVILKEISRGNLKFKPLPLTEEWLLRFGFENMQDGWYSLDGEQFSWNIYDKTIRFRGMWISEPEYVHQLQNLYFAITGEELQIIK